MFVDSGNERNNSLTVLGVLLPASGTMFEAFVVLFEEGF